MIEADCYQELRPIPWYDIALVVAAEFHVLPEDLQAARGPQHRSMARYVAFYLMRKRAGMSYPAIGRVFGRNHSTVIHGCNMVRARMAAQDGFRAVVEALEAKLILPT